MTNDVEKKIEDSGIKYSLEELLNILSIVSESPTEDKEKENS
jgi:hypothetical protein